MATKKLDFNNPLLNGSEPTEKKRNTRRNDKLIRNEEGGNSNQEGLPQELTRFVAICYVEDVDFIRDFAYTKRTTIKETIHHIISTYAEEYRSNPKNEKLLDHRKKGGSL